MHDADDPVPPKNAGLTFEEQEKPFLDALRAEGRLIEAPKPAELGELTATFVPLRTGHTARANRRKA